MKWSPLLVSLRVLLQPESSRVAVALAMSEWLAFGAVLGMAVPWVVAGGISFRVFSALGLVGMVTTLIALIYIRVQVGRPRKDHS
jgi:hypothetical protein